ncbi:MAG TPA: 6,7-dimethyl-8-ribityllumazine synthase [Vicinamibacteria bacterium]|nr:6,7-dimethyl-8-ribityllumazine synthase [Vicinamibacteria bacterium]
MKEAPSSRPQGRGLRVAVVRARFNPGIVDGLSEGAEGALTQMGVAHVVVMDAPGAFELPLAAGAAAASGRFDAVVALGAVIRGDTDHYEHIAREAAAGLQRTALDTGVPVGFGVLTCATEAQAVERSRPGPGNKGAEAARAAVALALTLRSFRRPARPQRSRRGPERTQRRRKSRKAHATRGR